MYDVTRNSYSLYKRESGSRTIWHVRFWDDEIQSYSSGRSTSQTTKAAAQRKKKDLKATRNRLVAAIVNSMFMF